MARICLFTLYIPLALLLSINNVYLVQAKLSPAFFVFGDSFYDTGDSNYLATATMRANITPYGETFFKKATGRFSNGRLITDFIAQYANLPFLPPFLQPGLMSYKNGVNFACAGAGAVNETFQGRVISLETQVDNYKKVIVNLRQQFGYGKSKAILSKAVYMLNIGTNDYLYLLSTNPTALTPQYVGLVVGNITSATKEIYRLGGRKFAINNVAPLGCFPIVKAAVSSNGTCVLQLQQIVSLHNLQLSQALSALSTQYTDMKYGLFDIYGNLEKRISDPTNYGLKDSTTACCGSGPFRGVFSCGGQGNLTTYELCPNPKEYLFWDSVHPSETTYHELADLIWAGSQPDIAPFNVKTLLNF